VCARASAFFRLFSSAFSARLLPPPNGHARLLALAGDRCGVGEGEAESGVGSCVGEGTVMEEGTRRVTVPVGESVSEWYT
jgi:hypothetical protein